MKDIIEVLNIKEMTNCYGMTETSPVSTQTQRNEEWEYKISTVGKLLPHLEAKIIDHKGMVRNCFFF
jgi:fatty-acyl-CoA synthase